MVRMPGHSLDEKSALVHFKLRKTGYAISTR
jgi:hypothetical protein